MSVKPPDLLNRLPSVSELLDKPPIRALAERWNRSVVAGGVKSFLDELKTDFQRRAAELSLPSIRDLAERAARFVVSQQQHALGVAINATGRIWDSTWAAPPMADAALERAIATGREFVLDSRSADATSPQLKALLCRLSSAPAAAVVHSYAGAVYLALATLAADREVLVARAEVADLGSADSLPKLAHAARAVLAEVGTTNSTVAADYEAAASDRTAAILKLNPDTYRIVGKTAAAELDELVSFARDQELVLIDALGIALLADPPPAIPSSSRSARASFVAGADLVILRGDGLVGGPPCGILLGSDDVINRIATHPLFAAWRLDAPRSAALTATLECYANPTGVADSIPVWQCLSVSIENLRNRAERIAPQLALADGIASSTAVETKSPLSEAHSEGMPSFGIALSPTDGDLHALDARLRSARFPILGRIEKDRLILDLRTVFPRQDTSLVDALTKNESDSPRSEP